MRRLLFSLLAAVQACAEPPAEPAPEAPRRPPNVLLIVTDQHERSSMSCAGDPVVRTPHLDRIAREGVRFTRCYQQSPICVPSRVSLQTALYTARHGTMSNKDDVPEGLATAALLFQEAGYATGYFGKMHIPRAWARAHGWGATALSGDYQTYLEGLGLPNYLTTTSRPFDERSNWWTGTAPVPREHAFAAWATDRALDFIDLVGDAPWHVTVSYHGPHPPWMPPEPYDSLYDPATIELPPQKADEHEGLPFRIARSMQLGMGMPDEAKRNAAAKYYGLVSLIDDQVGRLLARLEERGMLDDTVVVMTSDHGEMLGSHHCFGKGFLYEPNVGVALLVRYPPRVPGGRVSDAIVEAIDVPQTLLDLAGLTPLEGADGRSFRALLEGETGTHRTFAHCAHTHPWDRAGYMAMVCADAYKLMWYHADGPEPQLLFDLRSDPREHVNLIDSPEHAEARRGLWEEMRRWHDSMGFDPD